MIVKGKFQVQMKAEPPYSTEDGITLTKAVFSKQFEGDLDAKGTVEWLGVRTPVEGSAAYVGVERVVGTLAGRRGSFIFLHSATAAKGGKDLSIAVVPDSGTGELRGLSGSMSIDIVEGQHFYTFDYELQT
ncbi:MAG: DUF3224 domain-containing protein [Polyangiaceae bacterium]|nr:DUF3224 domain-containing protein [Polyangiaceae bacterium]